MGQVTCPRSACTLQGQAVLTIEFWLFYIIVFQTVCCLRYSIHGTRELHAPMCTHVETFKGVHVQLLSLHVHSPVWEGAWDQGRWQSHWAIPTPPSPTSRKKADHSLISLRHTAARWKTSQPCNQWTDIHGVEKQRALMSGILQFGVSTCSLSERLQQTLIMLLTDAFKILLMIDYIWTLAV